MSLDSSHGHTQSGSVSYSRIADRYEQVRGGDARAVALAGALGPWLPDGVVCDVGAGTGVVTRHLERPSLDAVACDLSVEMLAQASGRLPGRTHVADATALALRKGSVDAVVFVWVLHHVGDLHAVLGNARRVLRPGGRIASISGLSDPVDDDMAPIFEHLNDELRPERFQQALAVTTVGRHVGFDVLHEGVAATTASVSPNELATSIEDRLFSHLWDLPEAQWQQVVQPAIDELRSLPRPDEPRTRRFHHPLVVLKV